MIDRAGRDSRALACQSQARPAPPITRELRPRPPAELFPSRPAQLANKLSRAANSSATDARHFSQAAASRAATSAAVISGPARPIKAAARGRPSCGMRLAPERATGEQQGRAMLSSPSGALVAAGARRWGPSSRPQATTRARFIRSKRQNACGALLRAARATSARRELERERAAELLASGRDVRARAPARAPGAKVSRGRKWPRDLEPCGRAEVSESELRA